MVFETIKVLETDLSPVLLSEDTLVLSDEFSEVRVMNWRTDEYAILKSSSESDDVIQVSLIHASLTRYERTKRSQSVINAYKYSSPTITSS